MATGIPKTKWTGADHHLPLAASDERCAVTLSYSGKQTETDILSSTQASQVFEIWRGGNSSNRLYFGDNVGILSSLIGDRNVCGKVRVIYIDPPFATKSVFKSRNHSDAYCDLLAGPQYLEFMRQRLILMRELLADDGSIYLHLDDNAAFEMKLIMDEVFGRTNFRNWITRKKCNPKNYTRKTYGNVADYILFYSKSDSYIWNRPVEPWHEADNVPKEYQYVEAETGRRFMKVPLHAPGVRNGQTGQPWRGMLPPPGKHWQYTPDRLEEMDARGEIYWSPNGNPRRKVYLDESAGVPVQDVWLDFKDAHNQNICITGYPTEKNPAMLERIVAASSNVGDLVLDSFSGSGTTLVAAQKLSRNWIGIDNSSEAISTTLRRFLFGTEAMGDFVAEKKKSAGPSAHVPVSDFSILVDIERQSEAKEITTDWIARLQQTRRLTKY